MIVKTAEAVIQRFKSDIISNLLMGLYLTQAPQDAVMPFSTFHFIGISTDEIMGDKYDNITNIRIQFSIFCEANDGGVMITNLVERLADCYDWCELTVLGYKSIKMQRETIGPIILSDENIWQGTIDYEISIQKF